MKRYYAGLAAIAVLAGGLSTGPASAVPPTVTPSPGYDARLQEQRKAQGVGQSVVPVARPVTRRHKQPHRGAH